MTDILSLLQQKLGADTVLGGADVSRRYHVDYTGENPCAPVALVRPASTEELSRALEICHAHGQRVVIQGGMTGLAGGSTPRAGEVAIALDRMSGIEEVDRAAMTLTALAGTPLERVQDAARDADLTFPLDMGARGSCTIGGNIATNAGGNEVIRFGMVRNLVLGLEAVLADGTVVSSMNKMLKNNSGYDLKQLFIGSEGTLGVVTRAVLRLFPRLPSCCTALAGVADFPAALDLLQTVQSRLGSSLSAFEVMWAPYFDCVLEITKLRSPLSEGFPLYVLIETEGFDQVADQAQFDETLAWALESGIIGDAVVAQSEKDTQHFWEIRDGIGEITPRLYPLLVFDVSLPLHEMEDFLARTDSALRQRFAQVTNLVFGHVGDNNLHLAITTGKEADMPAVCEIVYEAVGAHQGAIAAEHGVGTLRLPYLRYSRSPTEIALMKRLKKALDPRGILNSGRVFAAD
jgi:FAD/FMN-containing dehydrogenase